MRTTALAVACSSTGGMYPVTWGDTPPPWRHKCEYGWLNIFWLIVLVVGGNFALTAGGNLLGAARFDGIRLANCSGMLALAVLR